MRVRYMGKTQDVIVRGHSMAEKWATVRTWLIVGFIILVAFLGLRIVAEMNAARAVTNYRMGCEHLSDKDGNRWVECSE